jgi:hypothetical protein
MLGQIVVAGNAQASQRLRFLLTKASSLSSGYAA